MEPVLPPKAAAEWGRLSICSASSRESLSSLVAPLPFSGSPSETPGRRVDSSGNLEFGDMHSLRVRAYSVCRLIRVMSESEPEPAEAELPERQPPRELRTVSRESLNDLNGIVAWGGNADDDCKAL